MGATARLNSNLEDFRYKSIVHQDLTSEFIYVMSQHI